MRPKPTRKAPPPVPLTGYPCVYCGHKTREINIDRTTGQLVVIHESEHLEPCFQPPINPLEPHNG